MQTTIRELTPDAFAPYGKIVEKPARATDASGPGWQWWGELLELGGGAEPSGARRNYAAGYLDLRPASLRFDWAERHMDSDEMIIPLSGDCLVYVAPADHPDQPAQMPALDQFQVFRVRQGQAVLLNRGVWHGAPLAEDRPLNALVLLLHNTGKQDVFINRFESTPVEILK